MQQALTEQVGAALQSKTALYDLCCRQDIVLPSIKSHLVNANFLHLAFTGAVYLPKQADTTIVQRLNTPPKKMCFEILDKLLLQHLDHVEFGSRVNELRKHLLLREADKTFYLVLIRHFDKDNFIFQPGYCPPARPKKESQSQFLSQKSLELYQKALESVPALIQGKRGRLKRGGIVGQLEKPKVMPKAKSMKAELQEKQAEIESLLLSQQMNQVNVQPVNPFMNAAPRQAEEEECKANIIGNLADQEEEVAHSGRVEGDEAMVEAEAEPSYRS